MPCRPPAQSSPAPGSSIKDKRRTAADRATAERLLTALRNGMDVRRRKVRRLKAAIKVRAYENPLKLAVALERLVAPHAQTSRRAKNRRN